MSTGWMQRLGAQRLAHLTRTVPFRIVSRTRELVSEGACCSCHLSPPCSFCTSMLDYEVDAYARDGMAGLWAIWDALDEQQEEQHHEQGTNPVQPAA